MSRVPHLLREWPRIRRKISRPRQVALLTDFDGSRIPIQRRHDGGYASPAARRLLATTAGRGAVVGVISGRRLEDVEERVAVPGLWYAGVHGYFLRDPSKRFVSRLDATGRARVARAARLLEEGLTGVPRVAVEKKSATVAVHYRRASRRGAEYAGQLVRDVARRTGLDLLSGKKIWELCADGKVDKWSAVQFILARERRRNPIAGRVTVYLGDDTTDESVFARLRGVSVAVGKRHRTAARYYLRSPKEVRMFLERVCRDLT